MREAPKVETISRFLRTRAALVFSLMFCMGGCQKRYNPATTPLPGQVNTKEMPASKKTAKIGAPVATFVVDGKPFCFSGTNNYYLPWHEKSMVDDVLDSAVQLNMDVIRTWAFLDIGALDGVVPHVDDTNEEKGTKGGVYFQYWDTEAKMVKINEGENGMPHLDYLLDGARKRGLKVILVLTNNWHDMGGVDQYLVWYGVAHHHQFFTDETIRHRFREWMRYLANRVNSYNGVVYKDDPTIFAWELGNELRCRNNEAFDAESGWDHTTMVAWADEMSAYMKGVDSNHLVAFGDEGILNDKTDHWTHNAFDGGDHEAIVALDNIDFATFHLYPDNWEADDTFGNLWIREHLEAAQRHGKPTIMEEYGTRVQRNTETLDIEAGWERRKNAYDNWHGIMRQEGGNGTLLWMLAGIDVEHGMYPDYDGYTIYKDKPTGVLMKAHGETFRREAMACRLAGDLTTTVPKSPFVQVVRFEE